MEEADMVEGGTEDTAECSIAVEALGTAAEPPGMAADANGMAAIGTEAAPALSSVSATRITGMATGHGGIATPVTMTMATAMTTFPGITVSSRLTPFPRPTTRRLRSKTPRT